jgi:hypothetical protein
MVEVNNEIDTISQLMKMDIIEKGVADLSIVKDMELSEVSEQVVIWRAKDKLESILNAKGGKFETLTINGETYSTDNRFSALEELDDYIGQIAAKQRNSKFRTPVLTITINLLEKTITIQ